MIFAERAAWVHFLAGALWLVLLLWARAVVAADAPGAPASERARPDVVALWIDSALSAERRASLERLVRSELGPREVRLEIDAGDTPLARWIDEVGRDRRVLLAAALDADASGWKFYIVHVARGVSIERRLPGGVDADAAALEAVATILDSAVSALHDGLGLASPPVPPERAPEPSARERAPVTPAPERSAPSESRGVGVLGGLGVAVAQLGDALVPGGEASLSLRFGDRFGARVATALYFPREVASPYGSFRFQRSVFDLRGQALLDASPFLLLPELGGVLEVVRRSGAAPGVGVAATPARSHLRGGALLGLRASYPWLGFLELELGVHIECYTRALHFLAAGRTEDEILGFAPLSVGADLGVSVGRP